MRIRYIVPNAICTKTNRKRKPLCICTQRKHCTCSSCRGSSFRPRIFSEKLLLHTKPSRSWVSQTAMIGNLALSTFARPPTELYFVTCILYIGFLFPTQHIHVYVWTLAHVKKHAQWRCVSAVTPYFIQTSHVIQNIYTVCDTV